MNRRGFLQSAAAAVGAVFCDPAPVALTAPCVWRVVGIDRERGIITLDCGDTITTGQGACEFELGMEVSVDGEPWPEGVRVG